MFFEIFCWVETKGHDGNENSLDLMVILLLLFMNIIFVQIPSTNFENVHKFAMSCDLT
jgi:hypothetical protein